MAATILIAVGWFGYTTWFDGGGDHPMATVFGKFFDEFERDPRAAQQILLAHFDGQPVDVGQAELAAGYRPLVAEGLPAGYSVESAYVMKMPCCTCVQCVCRRSDGTTIAIFEHADNQRDWLGQRPQTDAVCNGRPCSLVEFDDRLAVTWQQGKRHITVVGARDRAEIDQIVAWYDNRRQVQPE
jgi:hypothetical protein